MEKGMAWVDPPLQGLDYWTPLTQDDALGCHRVAPLVLKRRALGTNFTLPQPERIGQGSVKVLVHRHQSGVESKDERGASYGQIRNGFDPDLDLVPAGKRQVGQRQFAARPNPSGCLIKLHRNRLERTN